MGKGPKLKQTNDTHYMDIIYQISDLNPERVPLK